MKTSLLRAFALLFSTIIYAQAGHIMQGVGAVNMSMGGAATGQPLDISGALHWNPAAISTFDTKEIKLDVGLFFSSPELRSSLPANMLWQPGDFGPGTPGSPEVYGVTEDDRGVSPMPALAMVWGKPDSKHTFGVSAFGISGFGVTFPQETNLPMDMSGNPNPDWNPTDSNPITWPQGLRGFGHIESDYMLLQVGATWAYQVTDNFSIGLQPTINYSALELAPNPLAMPSQTLGYPVSEKASAIGFGGQVGLFYDTQKGLKLGVSYKTSQSFGDFEFENEYLDGTAADDVNFQMDYPAIASIGAGFSKGNFDLALDFRRVFYENTEGFEAKGWNTFSDGPFAGYPDGSVKGFGWKDISILSAGIQYKGIEKLPIRIGYTYSSNPIDEDLAFLSVPATAIIKNAYQLGLSYEINDNWRIDGVFHYGDSSGSTSGNLLDPMQVSPQNPYGAIPGTTVSYDMTTSMVQFGISYKFTNNTKKEE